MINSPLDFLPYFNILLVICLTIGGFFAFRNGRQTQLTKFQSETNVALQQRIEALEGKVADFEKENIIQRHVIDTITSALKQRGMIITINGDMVTITDQNTGTRSDHRKRIVTSHQSTAKKEEA